MLTAQTLIDRANQIAGGQGFASQGLDGLNIILGGLCEDYDFALARGIYNFSFNPGLTSLFGSGPYNLPVDYLRTSGSSGAEGQTKSAWFLYPAPAFPAGQPMELVPVDLGQFDQYPQLDAQGIPSVIATDMGGPLTQRITLVTTLDMTAGNTVVIPATGTPVAGQGVAGEGIVAGTTVSSVAATLAANGSIHSNATIDGLDTIAYVRPGDGVSGTNIPAGAVVVTIDSASQVTISDAATASGGPIAITFTYQRPPVTLSQAPTATLAAASAFFGICPVCYVYPPPIGAYPVTIRYQRKMPVLQDLGAYPWFPNDDYLVERLAASQMQITGDQRLAEFEASARGRLQRYIDMVDDKTNRAQTIQMDASRYGRGTGRGLRITKVAGW